VIVQTPSGIISEATRRANHKVNKITKYATAGEKIHGERSIPGCGGRDGTFSPRWMTA
jgi:hypothetical protein